MKLIIAGSRTFHDYDRFCEIVLEHPLVLRAHDGITHEIVSGGAYGVDALGQRWAKEHDVAVRVFKPIYDEAMWPNKLAPLHRNAMMAEYGDALLALWDGMSGGTANMIANMCLLGKPVFVVKI